MTELLQTLCTLDGTSGREEKIREYILSQIGDCAWETDPLGNLTVRVKGRKPAKNTVALFAHMDEVGVIATYVRYDGLISFTPVGGIRGTALAGERVRFENGVCGVIGLKPLHLCGEEERLTVPKTADLLIDVGAQTRKTAETMVRPGDTAVFLSEFTPLGEHRLLSKALDDRVGCAIMLDMIKHGVEYDTVFCFTVQEEVGLRGAKTAAFGVQPDYAIVLEGTTAADTADVSGGDRVSVLGAGACVSMMDSATVYDPALFRRAAALAEQNGIPVQYKTAATGGNDAGSVHVSGRGVKTVTLNVPVRYIHSASSVCDRRDVRAVRALAELLSAAFADGDAVS